MVLSAGNFTVESLRTWYTEKHLHFLQDGKRLGSVGERRFGAVGTKGWGTGVDFWWNDEGETQWCAASSGPQTQQ